MIPRYKDLWIGVNWGSNSRRRALKNSAPSPGKFEFANSVISMNNNSGSFGGATLFTASRYARSGSRAVVKCLSPLPQAAAISGRTHNSAPTRKRARAFNDCGGEKWQLFLPQPPAGPTPLRTIASSNSPGRSKPEVSQVASTTYRRTDSVPLNAAPNPPDPPVTIAQPLSLVPQSAGFKVSHVPVDCESGCKSTTSST